ncbi:MAG: RsmE family RNA methyltransferase, partial [Micrococcales bacterium]
MVLPLFHLDGCAAARPGQSLALDGAEGKHAVAVRRLRVGEGIQVSDGRGARIIGEVTAIDGSSLNLVVSKSFLEQSPEPSLVLVQALAKGDRDELAIQAATELGAMAIVPWQAERSVSRWEGPKIAKGVERWQT